MKKHPLLHALLLSASVSLTPAVLAAPATLEIGAETGKQFTDYVMANFNFGNWMQVYDFTKQFKEVKPAVLRFPGGNVGDENDLTKDVLDVFVINQKLLEAPVSIIHTRVFATKADSKNKPQDAADAVIAAHKLGIHPAYWEIGNEFDLFSSNRGDPSWTPERYCATFRAQREAILKVDPTAKFAGPAVSNTSARPEGMLEGVVAACGDVIDMLTWHIYPTDGKMSEEDALDTIVEVDTSMERHRKLWADKTANPLGYQRTIQFGVTEFGLSWQSRNERLIADQTGALWAAEAAMRLAEGGAEHASYFALQATHGHGILGTSGEPRPTFYAYKLMKDLRGAAVAVKASDENLWVHAAKKGKQLTLSVINRDTKTIELNPAIKGWKLTDGKAFNAKIAFDEVDFIKVPAKTGEPASMSPRSMAMFYYTAE
ncbi:MAG: hypothetical protein V4805_08220 [Pseudomonadota bacterium]